MTLRQAAKMKLLPSLFSCVYSRADKLYVFPIINGRRYSVFVCFIYGLEEKNSKSEVLFAVCRFPLTSCFTSLLSNSETPPYINTTSLFGLKLKILIIPVELEMLAFEK